MLNALGSGNHVAEGVGALEGDVRSSYLMNSTIVGVEDTDAVLLVGSIPTPNPNPNPNLSPNPTLP